MSLSVVYVRNTRWRSRIYSRGSSRVKGLARVGERSGEDLSYQVSVKVFYECVSPPTVRARKGITVEFWQRNLPFTTRAMTPLGTFLRSTTRGRAMDDLDDLDVEVLDDELLGTPGKDLPAPASAPAAPVAKANPLTSLPPLRKPQQLAPLPPIGGAKPLAAPRALEPVRGGSGASAPTAGRARRARQGRGVAVRCRPGARHRLADGHRRRHQQQRRRFG